MIEHVIYIHQQAPLKPAQGQACNGCGVCCAAEPCPVSRLFLRTRDSVCKALQWSDTDKRYYCGMVVQPKAYLRWIPYGLSPLAARIFKRWIAADWMCDSDAIL